MGAIAQEWNNCKTDNGSGDMRPALPVTHFAWRQMRKILKAKRTGDQCQGAGTDHGCYLFITNHDGRNTFR
jgi:hypothetical protein